jgi:hypothetical protein
MQQQDLVTEEKKKGTIRIELILFFTDVANLAKSFSLITSNIWFQHYCKHGPRGKEPYPHFLELYHPHHTEVVRGWTQTDYWHNPDVFLRHRWILQQLQHYSNGYPANLCLGSGPWSIAGTDLIELVIPYEETLLFYWLVELEVQKVSPGIWY